MNLACFIAVKFNSIAEATSVRKVSSIEQMSKIHISVWNLLLTLKSIQLTADTRESYRRACWKRESVLDCDHYHLEDVLAEKLLGNNSNPPNSNSVVNS